MGRKKLGIMVIMAVALSLIFVGGMCWAETGVSKDQIKIGGILDLSGPIAFMGKSLNDGAILYFKHINEQGGIFGRKIKFIVEDDGYQSPRAVQAAKKLITRDKVFCMFMVLGSAQTNAMYPLLKAGGIPLVTPATQNRAMGVPPRKYLFLADTAYTAQGKLAVEYIVEDMGIKSPKIACVYQDDTPGHDWRNGVRIGTKYFNLDLLELPYKRGTVDFSSQMAKCKDAGITHVLLWTLVREPAILMKEAQRLQYKPTYFYANPSVNKKVLQLAGDVLDYNKDIYATNIMFDQYKDKTPALKLFEKNIARYKMCSIDDNYNLYGYQAARTLVEGLKRAGKDLTREGLVKALETFNKYDNGMMAPITWGPNLRAGGNSVKIFKVREGNWHSIMGGWRFSKIKEN